MHIVVRKTKYHTVVRYAYCSSLGYWRRHHNGEPMGPFQLSTVEQPRHVPQYQPLCFSLSFISFEFACDKNYLTPCQVACQHSQQPCSVLFPQNWCVFLSLPGFLTSQFLGKLEHSFFFMNRFIVGTLAIRSNGVIKAGSKGLNLVGLYCTKEHLTRGVLP